ncbi:hypothetical protein [Dyadobacter psychrophilus]|uniref:Uncharacterized protein n=1 Tax=Dyadobacter psychrophilus TaxID=651661 RepID=A0A1T5DWZ8_9BACT|nr:hypothetical protein [Dyadobacter psychrophilus]SKB75993.1 hypothetical protein SAMN05660293_01957 [Dyadobacter psychrophilus]
MEVLTIEVSDPKAKRLLDDLADLGLISIKEAKPAWNERWDDFSKTLPDVEDISEQDIFDEIAIVRSNRHGL